MGLVADTITTGSGINLSVDGLTSGDGLNLTSTSTALTTGSLADLSWLPGSLTTATGDLFKITLGANGNVGNLFALYDNTTELFSVDETKITSAIPHEFTAAGDVSVAYDLIFTNQTSSLIESYGPLTISSGESFENNDLTLRAYGTGSVLVDSAALGIDTGEKMVLDVDDTANTYITHDATNDRISFVVDGTEEVRFISAGTESITAEATITAGGDFDIAEYYPTQDETITPGDVVVVSKNTDTRYSNYLLEKAQEENSSAVVGVVSSSPGFALGGGSFRSELCEAVKEDEAVAVAELLLKEKRKVLEQKVIDGELESFTEEDFEAFELSAEQIKSTQDQINSCKSIKEMPVALAGRVPVKVDNTNGQIKAGDLLAVSKEAAGKATKAIEKGWVIGRALEDQKDGVDNVMMFVTLTWYSGIETLADVSGVVNTPLDPALDQKLAGLFELSEVEGRDQVGLFADMSVLGDLSATNINTSGTLTAGFIEIDGLENSINSIGGVLKLQNEAGSGNIEAFGGELVMTTDGGIISMAEISADSIAAREYKVDTTSEQAQTLGASAGSAEISAGSSTVFINNPIVKADSLIFVTPETVVPFNLAVTSKNVGEGFTVEIPSSISGNIKFNWFIVGQK